MVTVRKTLQCPMCEYRMPEGYLFAGGQDGSLFCCRCGYTESITLCYGPEADSRVKITVRDLGCGAVLIQEKGSKDYELRSGADLDWDLLRKRKSKMSALRSTYWDEESDGWFIEDELTGEVTPFSYSRFFDLRRSTPDEPKILKVSKMQ